MRFLMLSGILAFSVPVAAQEGDWVPVTGAETLREFMSGLKAERAMPGGGVSRAEYLADGTGILYAWGATFTRTWEVKGEDQLCFEGERTAGCYELEKSASEPNLYRVREVATGALHEFRVTGERAVASGPPGEAGSGGGAAAASAAEIAAELANPNTALGTLNTNLDFIRYQGALPGAGDQSAWKLTFQPSLPYPLGGGTNFFVRPAIPLVFTQPFPAAEGGFDSTGVELGDIGYDASFGFSFKNGNKVNVVIAGLAGSIPTGATSAVSSDQWLLGPELGVAFVREWGAVGLLAFHQWDVAGGGDRNTSLTGGQHFYTINLTGGWQIVGTPQWSYNHEADSENAWTVPLAVGVAKTSIFGGRPWKMNVQYWYFAEAPDSFGPRHQVRFTVGPVVGLPW